MRFSRLRVGGFKSFPTDRTFDFDSMPGPLIAIAGPNGAGKTTLLELLLGGIYRSCPTRGALKDLAVSRDAFVEVTVDNGGLYTIKQKVDTHNRKQETSIVNGLGVPVLETHNVTPADEWIAQHFPPMSVVLVSTFAAQKDGGFAARGRGERKSVLLKLNGCERIEELAKQGRERGAAVKTEVEVATARLEEMHSALGGATVDDVAMDLELGKVEIGKLEAAQRCAEITVKAGNELRQKARERDLEIERLKRDQARCDADVTIADVGLKRLREHAARDTNVLGKTDAIRAAQAKRVDVMDHIASKRNAIALNKATIAALTEQRKAGLKEVNPLGARLEKLAALIKGGAVFREAAASLHALESGHELSQLALDDAQKRRTELQATRVSGVEDRVVVLRGALTTVVNTNAPTSVDNVTPHFERLKDFARGKLAEDDAAATLAANHPLNLQALDEAIESLTARTKGFASEVGRVRRLADRVPEVVAAEEEATSLRQQIFDLGGKNSELSQKIAEHQKTEATFNRQIGELEAEIKGLAELADQLPSLLAAEGRRDVLGPEIKKAVQTLEAAKAARAAVPALPEPIPLPPLEEWDVALEEVAIDLVRARAAVTLGEKKLADVKAAAARIEEVQQKLDELADDLSDWNLLAIDLGKDGLQATLIDATLPEINTLTNELLHHSFGPRFTVDLRTQAADSKGKRMLETLDIMVLDNKDDGLWRAFETYSPGEQAIVSEAISLSLTTIACREAGIERPTLVRDEAGAALDPENNLQWMTMLRRAAAMTGADKVLFVSHNPACQELADSVIDLGAAAA